MDLWIRSQDKETLAKFEEISYREEHLGNDKFEHMIIGYFKSSEYDLLGIYATKERALEVLDEIHNAIIKLSVLDMVGLPNETVAKTFRKIFDEEGITNLKSVYEMPKE